MNSTTQLIGEGPPPQPRTPVRHGAAPTRTLRTFGLLVSVGVLMVVTLASIMVGARDLTVGSVLAALFNPDGSAEALIIWELRVPRTVVGLVVGPALGLAGALIQAFTRNPLADPGILGVNAGAGFFVTLAVGVLGFTDPRGYVWFALLGAGVVTVLVYLIGSIGMGAANPVQMTLAGVALSAVLGGIASGISLKNPQAFDTLRFWGAGTIGGRSLDIIAAIAPLIFVGVVLALLVARPLNALAMGDDVGKSLGVSVAGTRIVVVAAVTVLAGGATALAGPIGFVGLMVPHMVRWLVGPDQRWILAYTLVVSPILLLVADILARVILPSGELRVGLVTAVVGAPILILLARRKKVSGL
ncbi:iron chelate uptake ABC transporter family permease subunit [Arthrobacter sp. 18067]|uniref:iron chelate uptake ABC transporter family permease subunit n=1 Tax=Arthrobacter sp. 18067 TaxID=2681413 RepID=UPI001F3D1E99|nr:iron chelate uptake ABC transporter family permease subunit [Arthrobacter sp. 18067]